MMVELREEAPRRLPAQEGEVEQLEQGRAVVEMPTSDHRGQEEAPPRSGGGGRTTRREKGFRKRGATVKDEGKTEEAPSLTELSDPSERRSGAEAPSEGASIRSNFGRGRTTTTTTTTRRETTSDQNRSHLTTLREKQKKRDLVMARLMRRRTRPLEWMSSVAVVIFVVCALAAPAKRRQRWCFVAGGILGTAGSACIVVSFMSFDTFRAHPHPLLFWRSVTDMFLGVYFATYPFGQGGRGYRSRGSTERCASTAFWVEFFECASEAWLAVTIFDLAISLRSPLVDTKGLMRRYHACVWLFAAAMSTLFTATKSYGHFYVGGGNFHVLQWYCFFRSAKASYPSWSLFYVPVSLLYVFSARSLVDCWRRLRTGLPSSFEARVKAIAINNVMLIANIAYWFVWCSSFALSYWLLQRREHMPLSYSLKKSATNPIARVRWRASFGYFLSYLAAFLTGAKGYVDFLVWVTAHDHRILVRKMKIDLAACRSRSSVARVFHNTRSYLCCCLCCCLWWCLCCRREHTRPRDDDAPTGSTTTGLGASSGTSTGSLTTEGAVRANTKAPNKIKRPAFQRMGESDLKKPPPAVSEALKAEFLHYLTDGMRSAARLGSTDGVDGADPGWTTRDQKDDKMSLLLEVRDAPTMGPMSLTHLLRLALFSSYLSDPSIYPGVVGRGNQRKKRCDLETGSSQFGVDSEQEDDDDEEEEALGDLADVVDREEAKELRAALRSTDLTRTSQRQDSGLRGLPREPSVLAREEDISQRPSFVQPSLHQVRFVDYATTSLRKVREHFGIDPDAYERSWRKTAKERVTEGGASGAFFFFSQDERFIAKSCTAREMRVLRSIADDYEKHVAYNPGTFLCRIYGAHCLELYGQRYFFMVQENLFAVPDDLAPQRRYDVKGSWIDRHAGHPRNGQVVSCRHCNQRYVYVKEQPKEHAFLSKVGRKRSFGGGGRLGRRRLAQSSKHLNGPNGAPSSTTTPRSSSSNAGRAGSSTTTTTTLTTTTVTRNPLLASTESAEESRSIETLYGECPIRIQGHEPNVVGKDNDLNDRLLMRPETAYDLLEQLDRDTLFMKNHNLMDYSLLLGVHYEEYDIQTLALSRQTSIDDDRRQSVECRRDARIAVGPAFYYLAVIDTLQEWDVAKILENVIKTRLLFMDPLGISAVEPDLYQRRFMDRIREIVSFDPSALTQRVSTSSDDRLSMERVDEHLESPLASSPHYRLARGSGPGLVPPPRVGLALGRPASLDQL